MSDKELTLETAKGVLEVSQRVDALERAVKHLAEVVAGKLDESKSLGSSQTVSASDFLQLGSDATTSKSLANAHAIVRKEQDRVDDSWDRFQDSINNGDHRRPASADDLNRALRRS